MKKILITGTAGFIGFHLVKALVPRDCSLVGLDNINDYYDVRLKLDRLAETGITMQAAGSEKPPCSDSPLPELLQSTKYPNYRFVRMDLCSRSALEKLFSQERFDCVVHLAAQAGVRYSLTHPHAYVDANIAGFLNILEACRAYPVKHLVYASSSSVYGKNATMPFSVRHNVDHPVSLYAASKKSNELMAHTYSHLFGIPATGLRFFTVYGPWGRPDMALFLFTKSIVEGRPIEVYNRGDMMRDFTYVDDITEGVVRVMDRPAAAQAGWNGENPDPSCSDVPHRLYNIGRGKPLPLMDFIAALEKALGKKARKTLLPMQPGDVPGTWADTDALRQDTGYTPETTVEEGIRAFVDWYMKYYAVDR